MARTTGSSGPRTLEAIREAGLRLIYRHGFEATSLRRLAAEVGIREGSLYNHIKSKQDLLFTLVDGHMEDLLAALTDSLAGIGEAGDRLRGFVDFHLRYHMQRQAEVFVINSELRSLDDESRRIVVAKRARYEAILVDILQAGQDSGHYAACDSRIAAKAIIAMLTGVCTWFKDGGRLSIDEIAALYTTLVLNGVIKAR